MILVLCQFQYPVHQLELRWRKQVTLRLLQEHFSMVCKQVILHLLLKLLRGFCVLKDEVLSPEVDNPFLYGITFLGCLLVIPFIEDVKQACDKLLLRIRFVLRAFLCVVYAFGYIVQMHKLWNERLHATRTARQVYLLSISCYDGISTSSSIVLVCHTQSQHILFTLHKPSCNVPILLKVENTVVVGFQPTPV